MHPRRSKYLMIAVYQTHRNEFHIAWYANSREERGSHLAGKLLQSPLIGQEVSEGSLYTPREKAFMFKILVLLNGSCVLTQSCLTLCDPMDGRAPGSSVHGIFQLRTLEWVTISLLQGIFPTQGLTHVSCVSCIADGFFMC